MASTPNYSKSWARIQSFNDSNHTWRNKQQVIFNLTLCGFYSTPSRYPGDAVTCHKCNAWSVDWEDHELMDITYISSRHREWCQYYKTYDAGATSKSEPDPRVAHSSKENYINSPIIRVRVGEEPETKEFFVHEALICPRSDFFWISLNGQWKESEERMVPLPVDEPEVFSLYLHFLYTGKVPVKDIGPNHANSGMAADEHALLSKLFVLAEKLMDYKAKEIALAAMRARSKEPSSKSRQRYPGIDSVQIIYEGTPQNSPARQLFVQLYTDFVRSDFLRRTEPEAIPKDFLYDLSVKMLAQRRPGSR